MKKFSITAPFTILLVLLLLISCKKDEDTTPTPSSNLTGTWKVNYVATSNCTNPEDNAIIDLANGDCIDELGIEVCFTINYVFNADGGFTYTFESNFLGQTMTDSSTGTWSTDGNILTICETGSSECDDAPFTISGNQLTISITDNPDDGCDVEMKAIKQ